MTELVRMLRAAIRYEVAREGIEVGYLVERDLEMDGWRQEAATVQGFDVWGHLYQKLITTYGQNKIVGDFGCGGGYRMANTLSSAAKNIKFSPPKQIYAIDIDPKNVACAKLNLPQAIVEKIDVCHGPLPNEIDLGIMIEIIEHCEKPSAAIIQAVNSIKDDGSLFISTPNRVCYIAGHQYKPGEPPNNPDHRREWAPWEFIDMVDRSLFTAGRGKIAAVFAPWPAGWSNRDNRHMRGMFQHLLDTYAANGVRWVADPEVIAWSLTTVIQITIS